MYTRKTKAIKTFSFTHERYELLEFSSNLRRKAFAFQVLFSYIWFHSILFPFTCLCCSFSLLIQLHWCAFDSLIRLILSCPNVHLICINDLSSLTVCLNLLICELPCICNASCNLSAYTFVMCKKAAYLLTYLLTYLRYLLTLLLCSGNASSLPWRRVHSVATFQSRRPRRRSGRSWRRRRSSTASSSWSCSTLWRWRWRWVRGGTVSRRYKLGETLKWSVL